ncbi:hypothetical protein FlaCF_0829 [Flavobacterium tructae]
MLIREAKARIGTNFLCDLTENDLYSFEKSVFISVFLKRIRMISVLFVSGLKVGKKNPNSNLTNKMEFGICDLKF